MFEFPHFLVGPCFFIKEDVTQEEAGGSAPVGVNVTAVLALVATVIFMTSLETSLYASSVINLTRITDKELPL